MQLGEALHVHFIKDGVIPGDRSSSGLTLPVEIRVDHDRLRHEWGAVALVEAQIVSGFELIAEDGRIPFQFSGMRSGIGIKQQLIRVETMAHVRLVGSMYPISVEGAGTNL